MKTLIDRSKENEAIMSFLFLLALVIVLSSLISRADPLVFKRFIGDITPWQVFFGAGIAGIFLMGYLDRKFGMATLQAPLLRGWGMSIGGALMFGINVIALDLITDLPDDLNVTFPISTLFYPAIGFVAEIIFHVVPFTLLIASLEWLGVFAQKVRAIRFSVIMAAFAEPIYQVISMHSTGQYTSVVLAMTGIHILCLSIYQLFIFTRHGFFQMYLFRLVYYMIWHVTWGYFRLQLV